MSPQFQTALTRAALTAALAAATTLLVSYSQTSNFKASALAAGIAGLSVLTARFGVEGYVDTGRTGAQTKA